MKTICFHEFVTTDALIHYKRYLIPMDLNSRQKNDKSIFSENFFSVFVNNDLLDKMFPIMIWFEKITDNGYRIKNMHIKQLLDYLYIL